jgi:hypothetical protein
MDLQKPWGSIHLRKFQVYPSKNSCCPHLRRTSWAIIRTCCRNQARTTSGGMQSSSALTARADNSKTLKAAISGWASSQIASCRETSHSLQNGSKRSTTLLTTTTLSWKCVRPSDCLTATSRHKPPLKRVVKTLAVLAILCITSNLWTQNAQSPVYSLCQLCILGRNLSKPRISSSLPPSSIFQAFRKMRQSKQDWIWEGHRITKPTWKISWTAAPKWMYPPPGSSATGRAKDCSRNYIKWKPPAPPLTKSLNACTEKSSYANDCDLSKIK